MPEKIDPKKEEKRGTLSFDEQETGISSIKKYPTGTPSPLGVGEQIESSNAQQSTQSPQQKSGQFSDISKYKTANMPAAGKMAQSISAKQQAEASNIGNIVQQQRDAYQKNMADVAANTTNLQTQGTNIIKQAGAGTTSDSVKALQRILNGEDFTSTPDVNFTQPQLLVDKYKASAQNLGTDAGVKNLLQDVYGKKGTYTGGMKNLDSYLLQSSPQNLAPVQQLSKQLSSDLESRIATELALANQAKSTEEGRQDSIIQSLKDLLAQETTNVESLASPREQFIQRNLSPDVRGSSSPLAVGSNIQSDIINAFKTSNEGNSIVSDVLKQAQENTDYDEKEKQLEINQYLDSNVHPTKQKSLIDAANRYLAGNLNKNYSQFDIAKELAELMSKPVKDSPIKSIEDLLYSSNYKDQYIPELLNSLKSIAPSAESLYTSQERSRLNALRRLTGQSEIVDNNSFDVNRLLEIMGQDKIRKELPSASVKLPTTTPKKATR